MDEHMLCAHILDFQPSATNKDMVQLHIILLPSDL